MCKDRPRVKRFVHRSQRDGKPRLCSLHNSTEPPPGLRKRENLSKLVSKKEGRRVWFEPCCLLRDNLYTLMAWQGSQMSQLTVREVCNEALLCYSLNYSLFFLIYKTRHCNTTLARVEIIWAVFVKYTLQSGQQTVTIRTTCPLSFAAKAFIFHSLNPQCLYIIFLIYKRLLGPTYWVSGVESLRNCISNTFSNEVDAAILLLW